MSLFIYCIQKYQKYYYIHYTEMWEKFSNPQITFKAKGFKLKFLNLFEVKKS